ncbi:KM727_gp79-like protein [Aratus pisonii nudivirus]|nr:KM727_gp79-like protein [Aratus pisonii nudivirus]
MVYKRPISNKLTNVSTAGYQKIELVGNRYIIFIDDGDLEKCTLYNNNAKNESTADLNRIQIIINNNDFLSSFTGALEVIMNSFEFYIMDIIEHDSCRIDEAVYINRLKYLNENIKDENIVVKLNGVMSVENTSIIPILYRSLDSAYAYGFDFISSRIIRNMLYMVVGQRIEKKYNRVVLNKSDYENISKVPKVIKNKFKNCNLETINDWKNELFEKGEFEIHVGENNEEYINYDVVDNVKWLLIAGKQSSVNEYKVFAKTKPSSKLSIVDNTPSSIASFPYVNDLFNNGTEVFYKHGYVIACVAPKVTSKQLSIVTVVDIKQHIDLEDNITAIVDEIPTVQNQQARKRINNIPNSVLFTATAERLIENPKYREVALILQNVVEEYDANNINTVKVINPMDVVETYMSSDNSSDSEDVDVEPKNKRCKIE